ncbi:MAG: tRNA (guanosine(37)-N1)-methyltransferase TrmD [Planctomycetes bacterium RBG_16_43_13]|nr:MAG: tRNA (guanosine(37)-N1)-methyltransferase TrmD [Planctomycetes bacterium RBG_16_43_13]
MIIDIVTLFPSVFEGFINESIPRIAQEKCLVTINIVNLRDFSTDKHRKVDAPTYGGGPGMVIMAEPVFRAVEHLRENGRANSKLVLLTPQGAKYNQATATDLAKESGLIILCGHYEGFDERVVEGLKPFEISIGDYVLSGGEVPALSVMDSVVRLIPGVVGDDESLKEESFTNGKLEYPHYTRPQEFRGMPVPEVLLSGNHADIKNWRAKETEKRTLARRPDLIGNAE